MKSSIGKLFRFTGLAASVLVWMVILLSIFHNPWFVFTKHAFSDLGGPEAANPWIYNYGMILLGILGFLYSLTLIEDAANKIETVGGAFMLIAGIFLALIGLYPSGTSPHNWVSTWFFVQAGLAIISWGIGLLLSGFKNLGTVFTAMGVLGGMFAIFIDWPSVAVLEAYGICIIEVWIVLMLKVHVVREKS